MRMRDGRGHAARNDSERHPDLSRRACPGWAGIAQPRALPITHRFHLRHALQTAATTIVQALELAE